MTDEPTEDGTLQGDASALWLALAEFAAAVLDAFGWLWRPMLRWLNRA